jgi:hypothetical protein
MLKDTHFEFINQLGSFLPDRKAGKRGTKPISKFILLQEVFKMIKDGLDWRDIKHSSTCRSYIKECQRRGEFKNFFQFLTEEFTKFKNKKSIIDSSELESYNYANEVSYSGKSHNHSTKLTLEINDNYIPLYFSFGKGTSPDSLELDKWLLEKEKLPYELYLDMGYERYTRRREFKERGCQVRMEQKIKENSRKRGPRFIYTDEHKKERSKIERFFAWLQSFKRIKYRRERKKSLFHAFVIIILCYLGWRRKL